MEIEAAAALGMFCSPVFVKPLNVAAIMSAKAAMTRSVKSQQKARKSWRPKRPTYCSMIMPMDLPPFLTEA